MKYLLVLVVALAGCGDLTKPVRSQPTPTPQPTYSAPVYAPLRADVRRICTVAALINADAYLPASYQKEQIVYRQLTFKYIADQEKLESRGIKAPDYATLGTIVC